MGEKFSINELYWQVPVGYTKKDFGVLIGLCGYAGSGKDTAAAVLLKECNFQRVAFADPIRQAVMALDPLIPNPDDERGYSRLSELMNEREWAEVKEFAEVRRLMQVFGTEVGRNLIDSELWVKLAEGKIRSTLSVGNTVVTDVRFPNEARLIKKFGGVLVRLSRPGFGPINEHVSDRASESWSYDHHLTNDGTVESLHEKMRELVSLESRA